MTRSPAIEVLADLRHRGVRVRTEGDRLRLKAPEGVVSANVRETLVQHRSDLLAHVRLEERLLDLPLSEFASRGCSIEVEVPGLDQTLWFVPNEESAKTLEREGIQRGRTWTAHELIDLLTAPRITHEDIVSVARAKNAFSAEVVDVRPAERVPEASRLDDSTEPEQTRLDLGSTDREFD